ncbi:Sarcoplasmic/endoplasmic reticulum calcium ATPase 2 [Tritrichomonas musculus]|uniref:Calcium-transporting ATPase n=1 Tax=Tritrichomonas musculus TaxID=1915356 RepID=A0ABR2JK36_9EUKA
MAQATYKPTIPKPWGTELGEIAKFYNSSLQNGLTSSQVEENRKLYGPNSLPPPPKKTILQMILEQFEDKMVLVLLFAVVLGFVFAFLETDPEERKTAFIEPWVIIIILALNAFISVMQEISADKSVDALKSFQAETANVIRDGKPSQINSKEVVVGDIIEVGEGQPIPADMRIIHIKSTVLKIDESALTGESEPATKDEGNLSDCHVLQDQKNMTFGATPVVRGRYQGICTAVGVASEIGKIHKDVSSSEAQQTPLQIQLDKFGDVISKGILVICLITWVCNIPNFKEAGHGSWIKGALSFFKIAVSLAVAAIPEGLPAVVTTTLSLGVNRMAKEKAIVTQLPAVETLGCTSVICSDKTGTLTTNNMTVRACLIVSGEDVPVYDVEGNSYNPQGNIKSAGNKVSDLQSHPAFQKSAMVATLCNDAKLLYDAEEKRYNRAGEPTEAALKVYAEKIGLPDKSEDEKRLAKKPTERFTDVSDYYFKTYPKVRTHEFTRDRKSMSVIVGKDTLVVKGAYEIILDHCDRYLDDSNGEVRPMSKEVKDKLVAVQKVWAGGNNCYRCMGLAYKDAPDFKDWDVKDFSKLAEHEKGLIWCGAVGIIDPARDTVRPSIIECHHAGIRVIMCTGDNPNTATAIAKHIAMLHENDDPQGKVFTGFQWEQMSQQEKEDAARHAVVFARVEPRHKMELVTILQNQGHVVAMTGDGVNDSPALKKADIGVAMGSGTKVAQEAAKMILSDDSFTTIVKAVSEGRAIYNNTTAFIRYLITCNVGEVVSCFVSSIIGGPTLLRSTQLLFVNLVTDGLPATALGVNPAEKGVMLLPPRSKHENIVNKFTLLRYLAGGAYLGFATIAAAYYWYLYDEEGPHITLKQVINWQKAPPELQDVFKDDTPSTLAMSVLVMVEMFSAMTAISERQSILQMGPWENPYLMLAIIGSLLIHLATIEVPFMQHIFSTVSLDARHYLVLLSLGFPTLIIEEIFKFYLRAHTKHNDADDY